MTYSVEFTFQAEEDLSRIYKAISRNIANKIDWLSQNIENINPARPLHEQKPNPLPDRKTLDDIVFNILGLTEDKRTEIYWAVCKLVKNRLEKARSV
ncbi:MAG: hypothetical protein AB1610_10900 [Nitrospirota bacterium]